MISKESQQMIEMLRAGKKSADAPADTLEETLAFRERLKEQNGSVPVPELIHLEKIEDHGVVGEYHHYQGEDRIPDKAILFIFGGGFETGSVESRRMTCCQLAIEAKMDAFAVSYRQWPEAMFPAALKDCVAGFEYLKGKGYAAHDITIFGESAGGNLTISTTMYLRDHGMELPGKLCPFSPVIDCTNSLPSRVTRNDRDPMINGVNSATRYMTKEDEKNPYASPIFGSFKDFPPMYVNVGSEECLYDDSMELEKRCKEAGVDIKVKVWQGMFHSFCIFPLPESNQALAEIGAYIRNN